MLKVSMFNIKCGIFTFLIDKGTLKTIIIPIIHISLSLEKYLLFLM